MCKANNGNVPHKIYPNMAFEAMALALERIVCVGKCTDIDVEV
jgi:hypothetical protein